MTTMATYSWTRSDRFSSSPARPGRGNVALDDQGLMSLAPSIFAETPWRAMSERYKFVPTIDVVHWMRDEGFLPVRAMQSRSRIEGKGEFTKHLVRFRHRDNLDVSTILQGQEFPEITLVNSHDGTASYQLYPSIFRKVCSNGLICHSKDMDGVSVRHKGGNDFHDMIIDASYRIVETTPKTMAEIETFKQIQLTPPMREAFATAALELRDNATLEPRHILAARRSEDTAPSLWNTLNVVQENMIRGGVRARNQETGRRMTTKEVKSVDGDVKTNRALWTLAAEMAKLLN